MFLCRTNYRVRQMIPCHKDALRGTNIDTCNFAPNTEEGSQEGGAEWERRNEGLPQYLLAYRWYLVVVELRLLATRGVSLPHHIAQCCALFGGHLCGAMDVRRHLHNRAVIKRQTLPTNRVCP